MQRHWNVSIWLGFLLVVFALLSYFAVFSQFPLTRDFPWLNLLVFALGFGWLGRGWQRARREPDRYRGRIAGPVLGVLSVLILGFFLFYNFLFSAQLPASQRAPKIGDVVPDFTLPDQHGNLVKLSDSRSAGPLLLVFYRGYW
ncbi:MAG: hypothetical protein ACE5MH_01840 [Terriglobia bacterium]